MVRIIGIHPLAKLHNTICSCSGPKLHEVSPFLLLAGSKAGLTSGAQSRGPSALRGLLQLSHHQKIESCCLHRVIEIFVPSGKSKKPCIAFAIPSWKSLISDRNAISMVLQKDACKVLTRT